MMKYAQINWIQVSVNNLVTFQIKKRGVPTLEVLVPNCMFVYIGCLSECNSLGIYAYTNLC